MAFKSVSRQRAQTGKTVELVLGGITILGKHPILVVEHLGRTNAEFWNDQLAKASTDQAQAQVGRRRRQKAKPIDAAAYAALIEKARETLIKYSVRDTRGFYHDGADGRPDPTKPASKQDIPEIMSSATLDDDTIEEVMLFATDVNNFRDEEIVGDPKALAGES